MRRDVLAMGLEVVMARTEPVDSICYENVHPIDVVAMLEGGPADDAAGRAAIIALCFPGVLSSAEAIKLGLDPEIIEAARLSEEALTDLEV